MTNPITGETEGYCQRCRKLVHTEVIDTVEVLGKHATPQVNIGNVRGEGWDGWCKRAGQVPTPLPDDALGTMEETTHVDHD